jgi:hypothetical protein
LFPDHRDDLNWETSREVLERVSTSTKVASKPFSQSSLVVRLRESFRIAKIEPRSAEVLPLVQVADLFAGLGAYSHERFDRYARWAEESSGQGSLLEPPEGEPLSSADRERCQLLNAFVSACSSAKTGVSLESKKGLRTPKPARPLNFWRYEPQGKHDRAPKRR